MTQYDDEPLIGVDELAARMGQAQSTVRFWTTKGFIPAYRMPGSKSRYVYRYSEVMAKLQDYRTDVAK